METKDLKRVESLLLVSLQKEVQELKETLEMKNLKEETIAHILVEQDKAVLAQIAKAVRQILNPGKGGDFESTTSTQGNG